MLVLTRRPSQSIQLSLSTDVGASMTFGELFADGPIEIVLLSIAGSHAKGGLNASKEIHASREELVDKRV